MNLRVSQQTMVNQAIFYEQQQSGALSHLQQESSSGNRILTPSDDPLGAAAVINYNTQDANFDTELTNISTRHQRSQRQRLHLAERPATSWCSAHSLATQATNPGNDAERRSTTIANQVNDLLTQLTGAGQHAEQRPVHLRRHEIPRTHRSSPTPRVTSATSAARRVPAVPVEPDADGGRPTPSAATFSSRSSAAPRSTAATRARRPAPAPTGHGRGLADRRPHHHHLRRELR